MNSKAKETYQYNKTEFLPINVERYNPGYKKLWDDFISRSKNGTFLFYRDYMEYHSDRFEDYSLMFFKGNKLVAVMPANIKDNVVISHSGLTYGGIISDKKMRTSTMLNVFDSLISFLKNEGVIRLLYKAIPHIYHSIPAEEDLYALFINKAILIRRDISSTIPKSLRLNFSRRKKRNIKKSMKTGLAVQRDLDFKTFMNITKEELNKNYGVNPVHTPEEMELLAERFPDNIKLFTVRENDELLAGIVVYESKNVAHGQYLASTDYGKELNSVDLITDFLVNEYYQDKYCDYGISTENNGKYLNKGLIYFKEGFGARGIIYDFYEISII